VILAPLRSIFGAPGRYFVRFKAKLKKIGQYRVPEIYYQLFLTISSQL
jgi:hypothetical protein